MSSRPPEQANLTIPNTDRVQVIRYSPPFSAICAIGKAPFWGELSIVFYPADKLLEFEAFEAWLRSIAMQLNTIEGLCRLAFDKLAEALGDIPLRVEVNARTTVHAPVRAIIESESFHAQP